MQKEARGTVTNISPSLRPLYIACNIIVLNQVHGKQRILLGMRRVGLDAGQYGLPGCKLRPDETIEETTTRELYEQTGIKAVRSRPISLRIIGLPNSQPVYRICVLVDRSTGQPQNREPHQNGPWQWFNLDNLPSPIFEPARIELTDLREGRLHKNLGWTNVEDMWREPTVQNRYVQLRLEL